MESSSSSSKPATRLLQDCRKAAREQKWDSALSLIDEALQGCGSTDTRTRITILDTRVAVHLRLNMLAPALKDAKAMIRNDKSDGRGYIRCGQIELEKDNASAALKWYEQGLKHVPSSSQHFATISAAASNAQDRIRVETTNSNPVDPMQTLPLELVDRILYFIPYRQLIRMMRVCKKWHRLLRSLSPLIDTLAFPNPSKDINSKMLHAALRRLRRPIAAHITRLQQTAADLLADRMQCWQNWQHLTILEVQDERFVSWNLPLPKFDLRTIKLLGHKSIPFPVVQQILRDCPNLETAMFSRVSPDSNNPSGLWTDGPVLHGTKLRLLQIAMIASFVVVDVTKMFARMSRLESLELESVSGSTSTLDLRHMQTLRRLSLTASSAGTVCLPPSLNSLELYSSAALQPAHDPDPFPLTRLPKLESLAVVESNTLPELLAKSIETENIVKLVWVPAKVSGYRDFFKDLVEQGRLKGVRHLHLRTDDLSDSFSSTFSSGLPNLETLCLEEAMITGAFISDLIEANSNLRKVALVQCVKVSSDIVPWSKARGVNVERVNSMNATGRRMFEEI